MPEIITILTGLAVFWIIVHYGFQAVAHLESRED